MRRVRGWSTASVLVLVGLSVAACGSPQTKRTASEAGVRSGTVSGEEPIPRVEPLRPANARPYTVLGRTYFPMTEFSPYREVGVASWYGRPFHGQPTATGETYDMYSFTAAHKTLPIPSYARVTNLANGRQVIVRVNDRGPFVSERLIDLSFAAADRLGFANQGTTQVEVELILPEEIRLAEARGEPIRARGSENRPTTLAARSAATPTPAAGRTPPATETASPAVPMISAPVNEAVAVQTAAVPTEEAIAAVPLAPAAVERTVPAPGYYLQLGAFAQADNADSFRRHAATMLPEIDLHVVAATDKVRVWAGPFVDESAARAAARIVTARLGGGAFVVTAP
ncbi:septal ring lytic transglycosylase RlpA family protein [Tepidiphilus margaritifer]|uniref:septal ring lytic transglycosylase RlpA family protein n=1 Tax=Tepidiphilus margaritifer TaxID=203471 RepID=UPI0006862174|nr:septal ring lytic transglycosylase RlpA family protein [Tepidiphilus margaritifer]